MPDIIITNDGDIFWHAVFVFIKSAHSANCDVVISSKNCCRHISFVYKFFHVFITAILISFFADFYMLLIQN